MTDILFNASRGSRILCSDIVTFRSAYNSTFHILFFFTLEKGNDMDFACGSIRRSSCLLN
jgi:hypothetical protein